MTEALQTLPWLPVLPPDRCYAADLQLGVQNQAGQRVTALHQRTDGRVDVWWDGGTTTTYNPDHVVVVQVAERTPTRSAVAALRSLTTQVELDAAAERAQIAAAAPQPPDRPARPPAPVAAATADVSAAQPEPQRTADGRHLRVTTEHISATYHLIDAADSDVTMATSLCGTTRYHPAEGHSKGWRHATVQAVRLCDRCRWQRETNA